MFRKGREAQMTGDLEGARELFAESLRLEPAVGTLLNLAEVEAKLGDTENARHHFQEVEAAASARGMTDRAAFARARLQALPP